MRHIAWILVAVGAALATPSPTDAQQPPDSLPEGVTAAMIAEGKNLFRGPGICFTCHGQEGKGIPNLGADLTDDEWIHSDGSYEKILATIRTGVAPGESTSGVAMPPKGGANLNEDQLRAVAAYVWSLSRSTTP